MAAYRQRDVASFTPEQFYLDIVGQIAYGGRLDMSDKRLTDRSVKNLADGLVLVFGRIAEDPEPESNRIELKFLNLSRNKFGNEGLEHLAQALTKLPGVMESLVTLNISGNQMITSLGSLADAGEFQGLTKLFASQCSLKGTAALPPALCVNLPALYLIEMFSNKNHTLKLSVEALQSLPSKCFMILHKSKVTVEIPEQGESILLRTKFGQDFGAISDMDDDVRTVTDILTSVGVQPAGSGSKTKSARKRTTAPKCAACAAPRPRFVCAGCRTQAYCDTACQREHWTKHSRFCDESA